MLKRVKVYELALKAGNGPRSDPNIEWWWSCIRGDVCSLFLSSSLQQKSEVEENQQYTEIQKKIDSLFLKLDALSNFHFTPKPVSNEIT